MGLAAAHLVIIRDAVSFTSAQVTTITTIVTFTTVIAGIVANIGTIAGLRIVMVGGGVPLRWIRAQGGFWR